MGIVLTSVKLRNCLVSVALAWCALSSGPTNADWDLLPAEPTTASRILIKTPSCIGRSEATFPETGKIRINYEFLFCTILEHAYEIYLGSLPAGRYLVEVYEYPKWPPSATNLGFFRTSYEFTVSPAMSGPVTPAYNVSDMWWLPSESGWGLSLTQHANGRLFSVWFTYLSDGKPGWYVIPSGEWVTPSRWAGMMYRTTGPSLYGNFDPALVTATTVGGAAIDFSSANAGILEYAINGFGGTKNIRRQEF